jgi:hypothetical protein
MNQIGPVLVDWLLKVNNNARQFGALFLQPTDHNRFSHGSIPSQ